MSRRFHVDIEQHGDTTRVALSGCLNEDADLTKYTIPRAEEIHVDFNHVASINAGGIKGWLGLLGRCDPQATLIYFNCSTEFIAQINAVPSLLPANSFVASFYAPYYCEKCDEDHQALLRTRVVARQGLPEVNCPECGNEMILDAEAGSYFRFLDELDEAS